MRKGKAASPPILAEAKGGRGRKLPCALERLHRTFELWRKWTPKILDDAIVILVQIIVALLAFWHILHLFPAAHSLLG
jgi:hypothetical protein